MYQKAYQEAVRVADEIRSGAYTGVEPKDSGFFERKRKTQTTPRKETNDPTYMVLDYMTSLRNSWDEAQEEIRQKQPTTQRADQLTDAVSGDASQALKALGQIESGGNYSAKGPVVDKGMYKGQRAIGKYQVMEGNIPVWTEEILGRKMSTEEFLADPEAQEKVAGYRMQQAYEKHGSWEDAASVWFSGRPMSKAGNASDGYNTVPEYVKKFREAMRT